MKRFFDSFGRSFQAIFPYLFSRGDEKKEVTEFYPDPLSSKTSEDLPPRFRGFLWNDIQRCSGCGVCEKECPMSALSLVVEPGSELKKNWVSHYKINYAYCTQCEICVEFCPTGSLQFTKKFEGAAVDFEGLEIDFGKGSVTKEQREIWETKRRKESAELF